MSLPQATALLEAAQRREASQTLKQMEAMHAAMAPLFAGSEGKQLFNKVGETLRKIIAPEKIKSAFQRMWEAAGGGAR